MRFWVNKPHYNFDIKTRKSIKRSSTDVVLDIMGKFIQSNTDVVLDITDKFIKAQNSRFKYQNLNFKVFYRQILNRKG